MAREERPSDEDYYAERTDYLRQGDLFTEVPLGMHFPAEAFSHGSRRFVAGPFEVGFAMLLTPTCSMSAQGDPGQYAHPFRTLVPVLPISALVEAGAIKETSLADLRRYDHLVNYFYLPALSSADMDESLALLYAPTTLHHDYLVEHRIAQLAKPAAGHLKRQLASHFGGSLFSHSAFGD